MIRKLTANLDEESRACIHCTKPLVGQSGMLYILAPGMQKTWEFCSWYCLLRYTTNMLRTKVLDTKLGKSDLLSKLGASSRAWGVQLSKEELESPIDDPIEDAVKDIPHVKDSTHEGQAERPANEN